MGAGIAAFLLVPLALAAPITSLPGLAKLPAWKMDAGCERPAKKMHYPFKTPAP
jgi:hypothetical protein